MGCYFQANIKIHNDEEYQKYLNECDQIFGKYNGKYIAVDRNQRILEGAWNYNRSVLIYFDTEHEFNRWYNSDQYQRILKHRLSGAKCDSILINDNLNSIRKLKDILK